MLPYLSKFIQAFGTYKNVMSEAFPDRCIELDLYEQDIVDMANHCPGTGFYEYHKQFSATAAAYLKNYNTKIDWSISNNKLFSNIFTNYRSNTCNLCQSISHSSAFCPKLLHSNSDINMGQTKWMRTDSDRQGRAKENLKGKKFATTSIATWDVSILMSSLSHLFKMSSGTSCH